MIKNGFDSIAHEDLMMGLFVEKANELMGTPKKYNWWNMTKEEQGIWRKFRREFDWCEEE